MIIEPSVTIMTVAAEAGVSIKTVSRVLNNEAHVRPDTRERVLAVVRSLGYRPNAAARSLAGARSYLIGIVYDNPAQGYVGDIQEGAMRACQEAGYSLLLEHAPGGELASVSGFRQRLATRGLDGVIVTAPLTENVRLMEEIEVSGTPMVRLGGAELTGLDVPNVRINDAAAAEAATLALLDLGHRQFGIVEGPSGHRASAGRIEGIARALASRGLALSSCRRVTGDFTYRSGLEAGESLLAGGGHPSAIIACNDDMAAGVLAVAHKHGLQVPTRLSVTGFDDSAFARLIWPPLTTVRQPLREMGQAAVRALLERRAGETSDAGDIVLDFELVMRESTAGVAV